MGKHGSGGSKTESSESPSWRQDGSPGTNAMVSFINKSLAKFESAPDKKKKSNSLSLLTRDMVIDFVFHVAKIEGEGLDSVEEVREALDAFDQQNEEFKASLSGFDKAKLMSTLNLYRALSLVKLWSAERSKLPLLDVSMVLRLHKLLGENTKDQVDAGEFRRGAAWTLTTEGQKHCYLDPKKIQPALEQLLRTSNDLIKQLFSTKPCSSSSLLNFAASFFYKFESIHPFRDGNGRVGRLLVAYLLSSIMPWGANNLYMHQQQHERFVDRNVYLKCFQAVQERGRKGDPASHPAELAALLIEGVYVGWVRYSAKL